MALTGGLGCILQRATGKAYPWFDRSRVYFGRVSLLCVVLGLAQAASAYSLLTHEQVVDIAWKEQLLPLLQARYPEATEEDLRKAHASAYGGCLVQDLGYYPFGNKFFSDLLHYVRSGDFVENLL